MDWWYRYGPEGEAVYFVDKGYVYPAGGGDPRFYVRGEYIYAMDAEEPRYYVSGGYVCKAGSTYERVFCIRSEDAPASLR